MSKITLEPNSSGAGTFSIVSPDSNTNRTLTLPDASGNIIAADASTGRFDSSNMPAGSVIQVVSTTKTDTFSTTSESYADVTGFSLSITPLAARNKILVLFNALISNENNSGSSFLRILRDGSPVYVGDAAGNRIQASIGLTQIGDNAYINQAGLQFLDEPNTTSSVTYTIQMNTNNSDRPAVLGRTGNDFNGVSYARVPTSITVMEIAG